jgi:hypothetical protein
MIYSRLYPKGTGCRYQRGSRLEGVLTAGHFFFKPVTH